jgi:hypothetical protein
MAIGLQRQSWWLPRSDGRTEWRRGPRPTPGTQRECRPFAGAHVDPRREAGQDTDGTGRCKSGTIENTMLYLFGPSRAGEPMKRPGGIAVRSARRPRIRTSHPGRITPPGLRGGDRDRGETLGGRPVTQLAAAVQAPAKHLTAESHPTSVDDTRTHRNESVPPRDGDRGETLAGRPVAQLALVVAAPAERLAADGDAASELPARADGGEPVVPTRPSGCGPSRTPGRSR